MCFSTVGTNDAETSALHIIVGRSPSVHAAGPWAALGCFHALAVPSRVEEAVWDWKGSRRVSPAGDSLPMDVSAVHHNSTLLRYSVSLLGYGFYGDIIKDSEKKRWMGLVRYDFSGNPVLLHASAQHPVGAVALLVTGSGAPAVQARRPGDRGPLLLLRLTGLHDVIADSAEP